jgi:hypothetical protein
MMFHVEDDIEKKRLRVTDIYLGKSVCRFSLYFPNPFKEMQGVASQCFSPVRDGGADLFFSRSMQHQLHEAYNELLAQFPHSTPTTPELFNIGTPALCSSDDEDEAEDDAEEVWLKFLIHVLFSAIFVSVISDFGYSFLFMFIWLVISWKECR